MYELIGPNSNCLPVFRLAEPISVVLSPGTLNLALVLVPNSQVLHQTQQNYLALLLVQTLWCLTHDSLSMSILNAFYKQREYTFDSFLNDVSFCFVNLAIEIYSAFLLKDKVASSKYLF